MCFVLKGVLHKMYETVSVCCYLSVINMFYWLPLSHIEFSKGAPNIKQPFVGNMTGVDISRYVICVCTSI